MNTKQRMKILFILLVVLNLSVYADEQNYKSLTLENNPSVLINLKVASSQKSIEKGLMGVKDLAWSEGMLFDFGSERLARMWMKGMKIPLDFIFLSKDYKINKLMKKVSPCKTKICSIYEAKNTRYVIELKAGSIDRYRMNHHTDIKIK